MPKRPAPAAVDAALEQTERELLRSWVRRLSLGLEAVAHFLPPAEKELKDSAIGAAQTARAFLAGGR